MLSRPLRVAAMSAVALCSALSTFAAAPPAAPATKAPIPVLAWNCARPATAKVGDSITLGTDKFSGSGSDASLQTFIFQPSLVEYINKANCRADWAEGPDGQSAISFGSKDADPVNNSVMQCGTGAGVLKTGTKLTLQATFKLTHAMSFGGGNPAFELDSNLIATPVSKTPWESAFALSIRGRGIGGKDSRVPYFRITDIFPDSTERYFAAYTPEMPEELALDKWYTVIVTWDGEQEGDFNYTNGDTTETQRVHMWINGKEYHVQRTGHPNASPNLYTVEGPIYVGGNRMYSNAPIDLAGFAIYNTVLTDEQLKPLLA
ncbi:MAG TPA: hypothetical protein VGL77_10005, partial [Armatimonadota bacterium]